MTPSKLETFIVDSSAWIKIYEVTHPPDVFQDLWPKIDAHIVGQRILSPRQVVVECSRGNKSNLKSWIQSHKQTITSQETSAVRKMAGKILVDYPSMTHGVTGDIGDPWVIAFGSVLGYTIVAEEARSNSPKVEKRCKIPNICDDMDLDCISSVKMLRLLGVRC